MKANTSAQRVKRSETRTDEELRRLQVVMPLWPDAAQCLDFSRNAAYEAVKTGTFPVPVFRQGPRLKVLRSDLLRYLGIESVTAASTEVMRL